MVASHSYRRAYVIGAFDGGLVVLPVDEARRLAGLNDALEQSQTWSDFLRSIARDDAALSYLADQYDDELPDPDASFDADEIPGFAEGRWPPFPKASTDQIPDSVRALGALCATAFDVDLVHINEARREDTIAALRRVGFDCVDDDDLIGRACGSWRYRPS